MPFLKRAMSPWASSVTRNIPGNMRQRLLKHPPEFWKPSDPHLVELAKIAGHMHDIGNCVNRHDHPHSGAIMAFTLLNRWNVDPLDTAVIVSAIGQHDERTGTAVDPVSAALILADKTDVRRNRVRNQVKETFDKHDRVNYAALSSKLIINAGTSRPEL